MKTKTNNLFIILCFSSGMVMAQEGLIHQYKFDGNVQDAVDTAHGVVIPGAETATAMFVNGRDGTANGAITFPLSSEGCGAPDDWYFIKIGTWSPSQLGTPGEMTIAFWGFWYGPSTNCGKEATGWPQDIITKRDNYKMGEMAWGINQHGFTNHVLSVHHPDKGSRATASQGMPESTWTHVAISFDGNKAYFYLNGVLFDDTQTFKYAQKFDAGIFVGNSTNSGDKPNLMDVQPNNKDVYNGAMDDLRFYSRKLTDAEIAGIFSEPTSTLVPRINNMRPRLIANSSEDFIVITGLTEKAALSVIDLNGRTHLRKAVTSNATLLLRKPAPGMNILRITGTEGAGRP